MEQIDARGISCPQPVLMTKKALEKHPEGIAIIVDNNTAKLNVERFMKNLGYKVTIEIKEDNFKIYGRK